MKKINKQKFKKYQKRRQEKEFRRRRKGKTSKSRHNKYMIWRQKIDDIIVSKHRNDLYEFFIRNGFFVTSNAKIEIGKIFSIEKEPESAIKQLCAIHMAINKFAGLTVELDFKKCTHTDAHTIFLVRIIATEYWDKQQALQRKLQIRQVTTKIRLRLSDNQEVNKKLFAGQLLPTLQTKNEQMMPVSTMGIHIGEKSRAHYFENKKGATATRIVNYVSSECLKRYDSELSELNRNELSALVAEILNNAEDHSTNNKWYATGTLFEDSRSHSADNKVGELNITIVNFGQSFFEGLENTKKENQETYGKIDALYNQVSRSKNGNSFSKENYFTLYALQDGVSRLKFEQESRGTGTMKFINSFLSIGDYEDSIHGYHPNLIILSGNTWLRCDNQYKTFQIDEVNFLSLNSQSDLQYPPEKSHLTSISMKFPGTVLGVKVYFNKDHLLRKIQ